jgi:hypothetical protein
MDDSQGFSVIKVVLVNVLTITQILGTPIALVQTTSSFCPLNLPISTL